MDSVRNPIAWSLSARVGTFIKRPRPLLGGRGSPSLHCHYIDPGQPFCICRGPAIALKLPQNSFNRPSVSPVCGCLCSKSPTSSAIRGVFQGPGFLESFHRTANSDSVQEIACPGAVGGRQADEATEPVIPGPELFPFVRRVLSVVRG